MYSSSTCSVTSQPMSSIAVFIEQKDLGRVHICLKRYTHVHDLTSYPNHFMNATARVPEEMNSFCDGSRATLWYSR